MRALKNAILAVLFIVAPLTAAADNRAKTEACMQAKWAGVIGNGMPISEAFELTRVASTSIGPDFRSLTKAQQQAAAHMAAYAIKRALEKHVKYLKKLRFEIGQGPGDFETFSSSYRVVGYLVHQNNTNTRYVTEAIVSKRSCKVRSMGVEKGVRMELLREWIRDTPEYKEFLPTVGINP